MFYLTTHSTHFIFDLYGIGHMIRKEGHNLFNNTLNTFYLRLYGVRDTVKDHSDNKGIEGMIFHFQF